MHCMRNEETQTVSNILFHLTKQRKKLENEIRKTISAWLVSGYFRKIREISKL